MYPRTAWSSNEDLRDKRLLKGGFYQSMRLTLFSGRLAGLLPISGLLNQSSEFTRCTWKTLYSLIYIPSLMLQAFFFLVHITDFIITGLSLPKLNAFLHLGSFIFGSITLLHICTKWRTMLTEIEGTEKKLPPVKQPRRAVCAANLTMFAVQIGSFIDYIILNPVFTIHMTKVCFLRPDDSGFYLKSYFLKNHPWIYNILPFNYSIGIILQIVRAQGTFILHFITSTVAIISIYLIDKFKTFNTILFQRQRKFRNSRPSWTELQIYYTRLSRLVQILNDHFNPFVIVTFWTNVYYLSRQTFYTLNKLTRSKFVTYGICLEDHQLDWEVIVFLSYSTILSALRLLLVWYLAAELHATSRKPLDILYTASAKLYSVELQRLMTQIYRSRICLNGLNLFSITRGTLLTVIATVLTYELVLLQI